MKTGQLCKEPGLNIINICIFRKFFGNRKQGMIGLLMEIGILDFFHSLVKGRRNTLKVKRIQNSHGVWLEEDREIAEEVVDHFQK